MEHRVLRVEGTKHALREEDWWRHGVKPNVQRGCCFLPGQSEDGVHIWVSIDHSLLDDRRVPVLAQSEKKTQVKFSIFLVPPNVQGLYCRASQSLVSRERLLRFEEYSRGLP